MSLITLMTKLPLKCTTKSSSIREAKNNLSFKKEKKKKKSNRVYPNSNNIVLDLTWLFNYQISCFPILDSFTIRLLSSNAIGRNCIRLIVTLKQAIRLSIFLLIRCLSCSTNLFKKLKSNQPKSRTYIAKNNIPCFFW